MKTNPTKILIALVTLAALAVPVQAEHRDTNGSHHPDFGGQPEMRHFQPQGWSHSHREYHSYPQAQVMMGYGYYPPPPPPPVVFWGYPPPPPPPPPVYYYPHYRPGFNIMLNF